MYSQLHRIQIEHGPLIPLNERRKLFDVIEFGLLKKINGFTFKP
jgi:hypothetical protein